jgi:hypothetical protein
VLGAEGRDEHVLAADEREPRVGAEAEAAAAEAAVHALLAQVADDEAAGVHEQEAVDLGAQLDGAAEAEEVAGVLALVGLLDRLAGGLAVGVRAEHAADGQREARQRRDDLGATCLDRDDGVAVRLRGDGLGGWCDGCDRCGCDRCDRCGCGCDRGGRDGDGGDVGRRGRRRGGRCGSERDGGGRRGRGRCGGGGRERDGGRGDRTLGAGEGWRCAERGGKGERTGAGRMHGCMVPRLRDQGQDPRWAVGGGPRRVRSAAGRRCGNKSSDPK